MERWSLYIVKPKKQSKKGNLCIFTSNLTFMYLVHEEKNAEIKYTRGLIQGLISVKCVDVFFSYFL